MGIWVDTDFGFDDLWALLLLRHLGCTIDGVSLVAGNAMLPQVAANAVSAKAVYGYDWPIWQGADKPLVRNQETAERILGKTGMRTRGRGLDDTGMSPPPTGGVSAISTWLQTNPNDPHEILALGPLTNIAMLLDALPDLPQRVERLVWMGGSAGAGNHTPAAEFNAVADAEAVVRVMASGLRLDMVDLSFCRTVTFGPDDLPDTDPLTLDLLGGYLDIALERGRAGMAIYDPLAALAMADPTRIKFQPCTVEVDTSTSDTYGATHITPAPRSQIHFSVAGSKDLAQFCLRALEKDAVHGPRL